jgi:hypothetical protein
MQAPASSAPRRGRVMRCLTASMTSSFPKSVLKRG